MPKPAFLDLSLYIPAGGVNGFELNGYAVNGVGFSDNPFVGVTFVLDPYRSILPSERESVDVGTIRPSVLNPADRTSVQVAYEAEAQVWAPRVDVKVSSQRDDSSLGADPVSLAIEVEGVSLVPSDYRTSYVPADHPAQKTPTRSDSDVDEIPPSQPQDENDISYVPAEDRVSKVRRI